MAKHRHHHHHSKSPSRRPPSPDTQHSRPLFQGDPSTVQGPSIRSSGGPNSKKLDNSNSSIARHRHRSTPPRAEISRRRSVEEENAFAAAANASLHANPYIDASQTSQYPMPRQYVPLALETFHRNAMGDFGTMVPSATAAATGYTLADRHALVGNSSMHAAGMPVTHQYHEQMVPPAAGYPSYTTVRNRQASIHAYEGTGGGVDPRTHMMLTSGRPHRKYYISKREKGCLGPCNGGCCCGAFDRDTGLCGYLNCCGCCDRETKILKRIGSFSESDNVRNKRLNPAWCSGCCCAY